MKQDKWINKLRDRMKDYSEPAPPQLWEQLEQELNTPISSVKTIPLWKRWQTIAAVIALLLVSILSLWNLQPLPEEVQPLVTIEAPKDIMERADLPLHEDAKMNKVEEKRELVEQIVSVFPTVARLKREQPIAGQDYVVNEEQIMDTVMEKDETQPDVVEKKTYPRYNRSYPSITSKNKNDNYKIYAESKKHNWAIGLHAGNAPGTYSSGANGYIRFASEDYANKNIDKRLGLPMGDEVFGNATVEGQYLQRVYPNGSMAYISNAVYDKNIGVQKIHSDIKHKTPISVGLSVRFGLNKYWSLETGLTYTLLASDIQSGGEMNYYEQEQQLHYVGVPLKASRTLWGNKFVDVYASAGGAIEKCVTGKLRTTYVVGNSENLKNKEDIELNKLQWSVNAAVGAQYKMTKSLSIYAEPGVVHYFDDGSKVETIRKEHPTNFHLQLGVRLNLGK